MSKTKKTTLLLIPLAILLGLVVVYFLFPDVAFRFLRETERRVAGLEQNSIDLGGLHIEYLEGGQGDALVLLHGFGAMHSSGPWDSSPSILAGAPWGVILRGPMQRAIQRIL
jgi:hypothetical protein